MNSNKKVRNLTPQLIKTKSIKRDNDSDNHNNHDYTNDLIITLSFIPNAIEKFPCDNNGDLALNYKGKRYQFSRYVINHSKILSQIYSSYQNQSLVHNLNLNTTDSLSAFDLIMKLLFGFKNVNIPKELLVKCFYIIDELKIDNENGFYARFLKELIIRIDENILIETLQMSVRLNKKDVLNMCMMVLKSLDVLQFLNHHKKQIYLMEERSFETLITACHNQLKSESILANKQNETSKFEIIDDVINEYLDNKYSDVLVRAQKAKNFHFLDQSKTQQQSNISPLLDNTNYSDTESYQTEIETKFGRVNSNDEKDDQENKSFMNELIHLKRKCLKLTRVNHKLSLKIEKLMEEHQQITTSITAKLEKKIRELVVEYEKEKNLRNVQIKALQDKIVLLTHEIKHKDYLIANLNKYGKIYENSSKDILNNQELDLNKYLKEQTEKLKILVYNDLQEKDLMLKKFKQSHKHVKNYINHEQVLSDTSFDILGEEQQAKKYPQDKVYNRLFPNLISTKPSITSKDYEEYSSNIIKNEDYELIRKWIGQSIPLKLILLYRGTRDKFSAIKFHDYCDDKMPTLTIIKSSSYNKIFGGFTISAWDQSNNFKYDQQSFLFSITNREKYPFKQGKTILCKKDCGPIFGDGWDIWINHECHMNDSFTNFPSSYDCPSFSTYSEISKKYFAGSYSFKVDEIEVFHVIN